MKREAGYLIRQAAEFYGDSIAVTSGEVHRTFREQNRIADSVAAAMYAEGVRPGDKVGILGWNSLDLLDAWFGCEKLGAVRVVMHPHLGGPVICEQMKSLSLRMAFVDAALVTRLDGLDKPSHAASPLVIMNGEKAESGLSVGGFSLASDGLDGAIQVDDAQPWIIQFTSGTTGRPKPWCKSLRSWIAVIEQNLLVLDGVRQGAVLDATDVNLHFHALQSSSGFKTLFPYYIRGARTVLMDPHGLEHPIEHMSSIIATENVSGLLLHGTAFRQWLLSLRSMRPEVRNTITSGLRRVVTSLVGPGMLDLATELIGPVWCHTYGSTEQGSPVTALFARDIERWGGRGTVGRSRSPAVELQIVDRATGDVVTSGHMGEIEVRSEMSMGRYLSRSSDALQESEHGWLRVGDLGALDSQGALHFVGRSKDIINVDDVVLHPWRIEQSLLDIFSISRCAVVQGGRDDRSSIYVLIQFSNQPGEFAMSQVEEKLGALIDKKISWNLRVVANIPTAEGDVKVDRERARRLVEQQP